MIGRLHGEIIYRQPPWLMLDVNGVGYELQAPMSTFYDLPDVGEKVTLFTHLAIRDDAHTLYAFAVQSDRALFRALLKISGVGAKMALAILSGMNAEEFANAVQANNTSSLVRLPGIGRKTAERLIIEMRDRLDRIEPAAGMAVIRGGDELTLEQSPVSDAIGALVALGYKPNDANRMVRAVEGKELSSEEIIRTALKRINS